MLNEHEQKKEHDNNEMKFTERKRHRAISNWWVRHAQDFNWPGRGWSGSLVELSGSTFTVAGSSIDMSDTYTTKERKLSRKGKLCAFMYLTWTNASILV